MRKHSMRLIAAALILLLTCPQARAASKNLLAGAIWQYSVDDGQTWGNSANVPTEGAAKLQVKTSFNLDDPAGFASLTLIPAQTPNKSLQASLNGQAIQPPLKNMVFKSYAGVPATFARKGANELVLTLDIPAKAKPIDRQFEAKCDLIGLTPEDLKIQTGPIYGAFDAEYFTLALRTNVPAKATILCAGKPAAPESTGLYHRLRVQRPAGEGEYELLLQCQAKTLRIKLTPPGPMAPDKLRFIATGDSRSVVRDWKIVATALAKADAQFMVFNGDFVTDGQQDCLWDAEFFSIVQPALSHLPIYPIMGNHEHKAGLMQALFYTPSEDGINANWSQQAGPAYLIGIDGEQDFSPNSANAKWLEEDLQKAQKSKFLFVWSHFPGWSSGGHGQRWTQEGLSDEAKWSREVVIPLLQKYKASAFIVGHDHDYERSELPDLLQITSAGAGAPTVPFLSSDLNVNPYSKIYSSKLHYCLFDIQGDTWTMQAITPEGKVIDECGGKARE